jgi:phosphoribosylanthranilate isomerase
VTAGEPMVPAVKICGVCVAADAMRAAAAGAAYVGVILTPGFSRSRTLEQAERIHAAAGAARRAGVFVDAGEDDVVSVAHRLDLDIVQLHGSEPAALVDAIRGRVRAEVWKTVRVRRSGDLERAASDYRGVAALLLEGVSDRGHGGVGAAFDWTRIADERTDVRTSRIVVAGGLNADNVAAMIEILRPDVVDVSSGVEDPATLPGRKSPERVAAFITAVRGARDRE